VERARRRRDRRHAHRRLGVREPHDRRLNVGREAIGNAIRGIFTVFPDLEFETRRRYIRDDLVVQEWTARGTHLGKMNRAGMEVEPTGKAVEYRGMDVIPIADGLVARKDVYSDGVTLLRQLGLTAI
jgi:ketosteroid isomerase-like protein